MKEKYISPELELLCLAPAEHLANGVIEFDIVLGASSTSGGGTISEKGDVIVPVPGTNV